MPTATGGGGSSSVSLVKTGTIVPYGGTGAPSEWLLCDGTAVSRTTYATLFGVISTLYGVGDGSTTFNLPNLKGRLPVGLDGTILDFDTRGKTGGAKTVTLDASMIPAHTHDMVTTTTNGGSVVSLRGDGISTVSQTQTGSIGGSGAHENMPPYVVTQYIIKT